MEISRKFTLSIIRVMQRHMTRKHFKTVLRALYHSSKSSV